MKTNLWLVLAAMLSSSVLAQQVTNPPPAGPISSGAAEAPATASTNIAPPAASSSAPAEKAAKKKKGGTKKKAAEKKAAPAAMKPELKSVPLVAGPALVVASNVNVRGQAKLNSEVVARVTKGQQVAVLEEIMLKNSGPEEPSAWAKILLPPNVGVWVNSGFVDKANNTVVPRKLNVRGGPGENYSILGTLQKGETVKELDTKGDWTKIEAPTNAYAFVAAQYLRQETPSPAEIVSAAPGQTTNEVAAATPPAEQAMVPETPAVAPAPAETPATPAVTNAAPETTAATNATTELASAATSTNAPAAEEPPPKRIVQREGIVRATVSIQAPTYYALVSPDTKRLIDYLYTSSRELDLSRYKGMRIIVTGEEALEERWGNTPVITIQKIDVLD